MSYFHLLKLLRPVGSQVSKMFPVPKVWEGISPKIKKLILLIYGKSSLVPVRSRLIFSFTLFIIKMHKNHGKNYSVKWLKSCYVSLQRYCGDNRVHSLREIEKDLPFPRVINGLPAIIPKGDRRKIQKSHKPTIQFWLSVFSIYRVLQTTYEVKLASITDPFTGDTDGLAYIEKFIENGLFSHYFKTLKGYSDWTKKQNLYPSKLSFIQTASPSNNTSWHGMITDLILIRYNHAAKHIDAYLKIVGNKYMNRIFSGLMDITDYFFPFIEARWNADKSVIASGNFLKGGGFAKHNDLPWVPSLKKTNFSWSIGQLSFKEEAAGKLRVFAMVDFWTQNVLKPLHDELFKLLKLIPNDGTFDQDASVKRSIEKSKVSGKAFSFDLSSATDRLPISIQWRILDNLFPLYQGIGLQWRHLMVDRDFFVPDYHEDGYKTHKSSVRYTVGQPMGAYSSWAMLAVTHHWILQYSSFLLGRRGWELNYEILGDDLVIFDKDLANTYLGVAKTLGVEINLSKSIVSDSRASFEFAKRMICDSVNVSAISLKQLISESSMAARVNNFIYFSKLGLVRTVSVLKTIISRFEYKSDKDLVFPLISLLGYFLNSKKITLKDMLMALVEPGNDEWDLDSPVSLPTKQLLVNLKGFAGQLYDGREAKFNLSRIEDREDLAEENELLLSDMVVLHALSEAMLNERSFEQWQNALDNSLFGSFPITQELKRDDCLINPGEWLMDVINNYSKNYDPTTIVDHIDRIANKQAKIHHLSVDKALELLDEVLEHRRRWSIGTVKVKREEMAKEKASPIFRYILENAGRRSNLSYLRERPHWSR